MAGLAVSREEGGTADRSDLFGKQFDRSASRPVRFRITKTDHDIRMVVIGGDYVLRSGDPDIDIGHQRLELRQARHQPIRREAEVGEELERSLRGRRVPRPNVTRSNADGVQALTYGFEQAHAVPVSVTPL